MSMQKLIDLPEKEQDSFLSSFDVVLTDIDGNVNWMFGKNCL